MTIKPIETRYAGCRFRSRLEARWALFFDRADIGWQYEPQGFNIDGRSYLPDFRLTSCGTWVEVKGQLSAADRAFLERAATQLPVDNGPGERGPGLIIVGEIPPIPTAGASGIPDFTWGDWGFGNYHKNGRPWWQLGGAIPPRAGFCLDEPMPSWIAAAYAAARSARFEHGENGNLREEAWEPERWGSPTRMRSIHQGDTVEHAEFGLGLILALQNPATANATADVMFRDKTRRLLLRYAEMVRR